MVLVQIFLTIVPTIIITFFLGKKTSIKTITKIFMLMGFYMTFEMIYVAILQKGVSTISKTAVDINSITFISILLKQLLGNAIPEEVVKYLVIKHTGLNSKEGIAKSAIITAVAFMAIENYSYSKQTLFIGIYRIFIPIHLISQLIMAYFLIKVKDMEKNYAKKYNIMAVIIPIIIHAIYNVSTHFIENSGVIPIYVYVMILGIIAYFITFKFIKSNVTKECNEEYVENIEIPKYKVIIGLLCILYWGYIFKIC